MATLRDRPELRGLADNPALPRHLLDVFVAGADGELSCQLAYRDDLSAEQARVLVARAGNRLAGVVRPLLARGLIGFDTVPTTDPRVALAVAEHPDADPALLRDLAGHPDPRIRHDLAAGIENLPGDVIDRLAHDPRLEVVRTVAACQPLSRQLAEELSRHPDDDVRGALVKNPSAPVHVVVELVGHAYMAIRWDLAARPDLPPWAYERLARDPVPGVRYAVAGNPVVTESLLRELATERDREVRRCLVHNPAIPLDVLADLAATTRVGSTLVPRIAGATDAELHVLAASATRQVRMLVAERPEPGHPVCCACATSGLVVTRRGTRTCPRRRSSSFSPTPRSPRGRPPIRPSRNGSWRTYWVRSRVVTAPASAWTFARSTLVGS